MSNRYRPGSGELAHARAEARWKQRRTPLELGRHDARLGRRARNDNPYSEEQPQARADWFEGFDHAFDYRGGPK